MKTTHTLTDDDIREAVADYIYNHGGDTVDKEAIQFNIKNAFHDTASGETEIEATVESNQ